MNPLDTGILILLGLLSMRGYSRGFVGELTGLAGLVGGLLVASYTHMVVADKLSAWITNPDYARWAGFILVMLAAKWCIRLVLSSFRQFLYCLYLGALDRLMGGVLAFVKGGLLIGLLLMLMGNVIFQDSDLLLNSRIAPYTIDLARQALALLPLDIERHLDAYL